MCRCAEKNIREDYFINVHVLRLISARGNSVSSICGNWWHSTKSQQHSDYVVMSFLRQERNLMTYQSLAFSWTAGAENTGHCRTWNCRAWKCIGIYYIDMISMKSRHSYCNFTVCSLNIRSILHPLHSAALFDLTDCHHPDLVCLTCLLYTSPSPRD